MHPIEQKLYEFLEHTIDNKADLPEVLIEEFGERAKEALRKHLNELRDPSFRLRMSNVGHPLRQLMLTKEHGREKPTPDFVLKMLYGSLYESLTLTLLKASQKIDSLDEAVSLALGNAKQIDGTLDVIIDGKVFDIKTASPYAFDNKFKSWEDILNQDDFGYMAQGFGYAIAKKLKFGGWIVVNKSTGAFKVVPIPEEVHDELAKTFLEEIQFKVDYIDGDNPTPTCDGVVEETYFKKLTGRKILGPKCRWCPHKNVCHPGVKYLPSQASKAASPKWTYYVD